VTVTDGEATDTLHYGSNQDRANAGDNSVAIGIGSRASARRTVAVGKDAGKNSPNDSNTFIGSFSGESNTTADSTAVGALALNQNSGVKATAVGAFSGQLSTGPRSSYYGVFAGQNCTGNRTVALGARSARADGLSNPSNYGDENIGIGVDAIRNSIASGIIGIGQSAGENATTDDQLIITDRNGTRRMVMDLTNGDLKIEGTLTQNATL
jgi:hypothetical protein